MDISGSQFFDQFTSFVWMARWPITILFASYLFLELKRLKSDERLHAFLMFVHFFLVICSFWIIKPLKKGLFVGYYNINPLELFGFQLNAAQVELLAKESNIFLAIAATLLFVKISNLYKRQQLCFIISFFFLVVFIFLGNEVSATSEAAVWFYYLSGDLFSTLMVATFFAFLNDSKTPSDARRLYGLIGLGGVLGGFFGSTVVATHSAQLSPSHAAYICSFVCLVLLVISQWAGHLVQNHDSQPVDQNKSAAGFNGLDQIRRDFTILLRSRYIISIATIVCVYEMISTVIDYQFTATVLHFVSTPQLGEYFSKVFSFTNFVSLVTQLFLTGAIMTRFGITAALLVLPVMLVMGSMLFLVAPVLLVGSLLNTADNGFSYSINQSAKEALYVTESAENRYKAKAFIDIFVLRVAKGVAVILSLLISSLATGFENIRWLSVPVFILLFVWGLSVIYAGKIFRLREQTCNRP